MYQSGAVLLLAIAALLTKYEFKSKGRDPLNSD
jgi:hypothetical protein